MKIIKTYSSEHIINDKELPTILKYSNSENLLLLDSGEYIKPKAIIAILDPEIVPFWKENLLDKNGKSFMRNGQRVFLEAQDFKEVEYKPHPKYEAMKKILFNKTKMVSDKQRTEISEKVSREERNNKV
ncbi:hypothetical protein KAU51_03970 [Candidatus Parcubacteria bacterium]|nr:hypothetical protein [Candidatus Parcubacteria bacterium]